MTGVEQHVVGAAVRDDRRAWSAGDRAVALGADPHVVDLVAPVVADQHVLRARLDPLDRPAELARGPAGEDLLAVDLQLGRRSRRRPRARSTRIALLADPELDRRGTGGRKCGIWVELSSVSLPPRQSATHAARLDRRAGRAVVDDPPLDDDVGLARSAARRRRRPIDHSCTLLVPNSSWTSGEPSSSAASGSTTTGSGSYSTKTCSAASTTPYLSAPNTTATAWPT